MLERFTVASPPGRNDRPYVLLYAPEIVAARPDAKVGKPFTERTLDFRLARKRFQHIAVAHAVRIVGDLHVTLTEITCAAQDVAGVDRRGCHHAAARSHHARQLAHVVAEPGPG